LAFGWRTGGLGPDSRDGPDWNWQGIVVVAVAGASLILASISGLWKWRRKP
jgi:hypothetical protein